MKKSGITAIKLWELGLNYPFVLTLVMISKLIRLSLDIFKPYAL